MAERTQKKALIIEDEPIISKMCQRVLSNEGFNVETVDNGQDAEKVVSRLEYDLLLVDIRFPVESGADFYLWLLQEYHKTAERVIFMTGSVMGGDTMDLLHKSGRPYLLKPFRPDELKVIVNEFTSQSSHD